jgi:hypothetical protein
MNSSIESNETNNSNDRVSINLPEVLPRSPSERKRVLDASIRREERKEIIFERKEQNEISNTWESCCITMDRRAVQFFSSVGIIVLSMGFSMWQLTHLPVEEAQPYLGIMSLCLGVAIDRPKLDET